MTVSAETLLLIATWLAALATCYLAIAAVHQLRLIGKQLQNQSVALEQQGQALAQQGESILLQAENLETNAAAVRAQTNQVLKQIEQMEQNREHFGKQGHRERKWATLKACDRFVCDPSIIDAARRLWVKTKQGKDYTDPALQADIDLMFIFNQLESIALGIKQGLYIDELAHDHLQDVVGKLVMVVIRRETGHRSGAVPPPVPVVTERELPYLVQCYDRWFPVNQQNPAFIDSEDV